MGLRRAVAGTWFFALALSANTVNAAGLSFGGLFGGADGEGRTIDIGRIVSSAREAFGEVNEEKERAVGREAAAVLLGAAPLVDDPALQRYVNRVGRWVALHTERPDLPWRFGVLDSDNVNAFAAPGGYIFITRGLLARLHSEAELAGVLAHECVHVLERDHLHAVQKTARVDLAAAVIGSTVENSERQVLDRVASGFQEIYARGLDKEDEFQADRKGIVIATRAGYNPFGLAATLQTLASMNPEDSALALMFQTHPGPGQRLGRLDRDFTAFDPYAGQPEVDGRFLAATASIRQAAERK